MASKELTEFSIAAAKGEDVSRFDVKNKSAAVDSPAPTTNANDDFLAKVQERILGQADIISSQDTALGGRIQEIISGVKTSGTESAKSITSEFERQIADVREEGADVESDYLARSRGVGFETTQARINQVREQVDKKVKDLEKMKQEALASGNSRVASQIAQLQFQELQFEQQARQQAFSNSLGLANLGLQMNQEQRLTEQFQAQETRLEKQLAFQQQQAIQSIQLQFPEVDIPAGATFEEVVDLVRPQAEKDKARMQRLEEQAAAYRDTKTIEVDKTENDALALYGDQFLDLVTNGFEGQQMSPQAAFQSIQALAAANGNEIPASAYGKFAELYRPQITRATQVRAVAQVGIPEKTTGEFFAEEFTKTVTAGARESFSAYARVGQQIGAFVSGLFN